MDTTNKTYKVVRRRGDDYYSLNSISADETVIRYEIGVWAEPKIPNSKLFILSCSESEALEYYGIWADYIYACLFEVEVEDISPSPSIIPCRADRVQSFWESNGIDLGELDEPFWPTPFRTVLAQKVKLVKLIK